MTETTKRARRRTDGGERGAEARGRDTGLAFSFSIFLSSLSSVRSFFSVPIPSSFFSSTVSWIREYSS
ncbi:hypothetical protein EYF80_023000 [Liparis tanakae]|uniref:Uncharacterized protein n=1 Tax=Liparis tanakae TaxID=230148 RepID=A0A4Z2HLM7_9TELE|nr:hypothetical protein EYF80_023000 [Liparis tanakae]